jgi:hypothetical protein
LWNAASPGDFTMFAADEVPSDVAVSADGTMFAVVTGGATEIRDANLAMFATGAVAEREQIPAVTFVSGIALHPSGALVYQPFLSGPAPLNHQRRRFRQIYAAASIFSTLTRAACASASFCLSRWPRIPPTVTRCMRNSWRWMKPGSASLH